MTAYYNEHDPNAAAWLRELIKAGHIAPGEVDERSIIEVEPSDVRGFKQCHFFAGIGGWSYALRLAGWSDDRPVWTGSPPCQPFSAAGKQQGAKDERHLWPAFFALIRECRPSVLFGEQVAAAIRQHWIDAVFADLESEEYACGLVVLPACSVGAPHLRQRLWFVGHAESINREIQLQQGRPQQAGIKPGGPGRASPWTDLEWLECSDGKARPTKPGLFPLAGGVPGRTMALRGAGNAIVPQVAAQVIGAYMEL